MADVFVSYSVRDSKAAALLVAQLREAGVSVSWDRDIGVGEVLADSLSSAIAEAKAFVLLHPGETGSSDFIHRETEAAIARSISDGLPVLPVLLPGRKPIGDIGRFRYVELTSDDDFTPVIAVVKKSLSAAQESGSTSHAGRQVSFLASLLYTDLDRAPKAAAVVLDEIAQSVGGDPEDVSRQIEVLGEAAFWGEKHLGAEHRSVTSLKHRLIAVLLQAGRYDESIALSEQALKISSRSEERIEAGLNFGNALLAGGRLAEADIQYQRSLDRARSIGSDSAAGSSLAALGTVARMLGNRLDARRYYEEAVEVTARLAEPSARINALIGLCEVMAEMGDAEASRRYADEALWLSRTTLARDDALALRAAALVAVGDKGL